MVKASSGCSQIADTRVAKKLRCGGRKIMPKMSWDVGDGYVKRGLAVTSHR
jgi:hypothetical protein